MTWLLSHRADPYALPLADRHYSRQKPGTPQFVPPGRCVVLRSTCGNAVWVTSWPFAEHVKHAWAGAWICSFFRNEGAGLSSNLIQEAVAVTRWVWPEIPHLGMVTFIDAGKVRHKRNPGRCYTSAGFHRPLCTACKGECRKHGKTLKERAKFCPTCRGTGKAFTAGGLVAVQMVPEDMPEACAPFRVQCSLFEETPV